MSEASTLGKWGAAISDIPRALAHGGLILWRQDRWALSSYHSTQDTNEGTLESRAVDDVLAFKEDSKGPLESRLEIPSLKKSVRHFSWRDTLISCRRSRRWQRAKGGRSVRPDCRCA
jgi:hypothetical protein